MIGSKSGTYAGKWRNRVDAQVVVFLFILRLLMLAKQRQTLQDQHQKIKKRARDSHNDGSNLTMKLSARFLERYDAGQPARKTLSVL